MCSVLLRVVRLFLRICIFHVSAHCKLTTSTTSSRTLSYLTVMCPFWDPGSLSSPGRETCQQVWSRPRWSLMCRTLLRFPLCSYTFTYRSAFACCRWHSIWPAPQGTSGFIPHCNKTSASLFPHPHAGSQVGHIPLLSRLWRRQGSQAWPENFQHLMLLFMLAFCMLKELIFQIS